MLQKQEIHIFKKFGKIFVFDSNSLKVFIISKSMKKILDLCKDPKLDKEILKELGIKFNKDIIKREIEKLKSFGLLDKDSREITHRDLVNSKNYALTLNVTDDCNLNCKYCYIDQSVKKSKLYMNPKVAKKAVDFILTNFNDLKGLGISFYGGEPLLNFKTIKSTMLYANQVAERMNLPKINFHIATNGTLLNDKILNFFTKFPIDLMISMDGPKSIHDEMRMFPNGKGTFEKVYTKINQLSSKQGEHTVSTSAVITRGHRLIKVYKFLTKHQFKDVKISYVRYIDKNDFDLTLHEREFYKKDMERIALDYLDLLIKKKMKSPFYEFDRKILQLWRGVPRKKFCPAGIRRFGISPDGFIFPCGPAVSMRAYQLGDIQNGFDKDKLKHFKSLLFTEGDKTKCSDCWARYLCAGGCPLPLVRCYDKNCDITLHNTELAICIYKTIIDYNELLLTLLVDPAFLSNINNVKKKFKIEKKKI